MSRFGVSIGEDGVVVIDTSRLTAGAPDRKDANYLTFVDAAPYDVKCAD